jgi:hypothetical protein
MTPQKASSKSRQGVALVIVLAMLVLLSGLIVAFFNTVRTERTATKADANAENARNIADSTVNMVIAQVREATTRFTDSATWASQPGAIRTFSGSQGSKVQMGKNAYQYAYTMGSNDYVYKLYSADDMRVPAGAYNIGGENLTAETEIIQRWLDKPLDPPDGYVDLNEPFISRYPDPSKDSGSSGTGFVYEPRYPILDPRARANANEKEDQGLFGIVEGFDAASIINPNDKRETSLGSQIPLLPMPVKWLYVLKDGSIGPITKATEENPVIGRTAFWTDDECAKLNINIASEGTFWDTPSVGTAQESGNVSSGGTITSAQDSLSFAASQPIRGEYQRYPGHPMTTCLSPVLGWVWDLPRTAPLNYRDTKYLAFKDAVYKMSPFIPSGQGTSVGGSANTDDQSPTGLRLTAQGDAKVLTATKHLYNNVDEYIFQAERFNNQGGILQDAKLTPSKLEKLRGFITANSRSSELNAFNRPRVTIWPLTDILTKRTNYDNLFAFASTLGGKPFHFVRHESKDPFTDVNLAQNKEMLGYLKWLTGSNGGPSRIPGFGKNFISKYSSQGGYVDGELDQILTLIFDYVRCVNLVDTGTNRVGSIKFIPYTPFFGQGQAGYGLSNRSYDWSGQVTPTEIPASHPLKQGLKGMGRFITVSEAALAFYRTGDAASEDPGKGTQKGMRAMLIMEMATTMAGYPALRDTYFTKISCTRDFNVTPIFVRKSDNKEYRGPTVAFFKQGLDANLINIVNVASHEVGEGRGFMPIFGFYNPLCFFPEHKAHTDPDKYPNDPNRNTGITLTWKQLGRDNSPKGKGSTEYLRNSTVKFYPYVGPDPILYPAYAKGIPIYDDSEKVFASKFEFDPGALAVEIWSGECPQSANEPSSPTNWARLVQTVNLDFRNSITATPPVQMLPTPDGVVNQNCDMTARYSAAGPPVLSGDKSHPDLFVAYGNANATTVRSIEFTGPFSDDPANPQFSMRGDLRLGASLKVVPPTYYKMRNRTAWTNLGVHMVHGLSIGHGNYQYMSGLSPAAGSGLGFLAKGSNGQTPDFLKFPILPAGINGVTRDTQGGPGDWDRGLSKHMDGALGNKVDEGNVFFNYGDNDQGGKLPYYRGRGIEEVGQSFFTPNRQLSSAVMFGSLPTGVQSGKPWQTLLFRPDRSQVPHPGSVIPEDHLLLDLFHIPIVEPYAISEPFSTGGKANVNYIMAPFGYLMTGKNLARSRSGSTTTVPASYIHRDTALRGVLRSTKVMAVNANASKLAHADQPVPDSNKYRHDIDADETIANIQKRFLDPQRGLFRSASEICTVDLYPADISAGDWRTFWDTTYTQTGDNMRERPYSHIYPRITTKSNVYTVHMRCQSVKVAPSAAKLDGKIDFAKVTEKDIQVEAEYRGSAIIERYVDPNDTKLENYDYKKNSVDPYYRFRVISTKQFNPR